MKIVITGAAGRIGRQMTLELADSHELVLLDRKPGMKWVRADLAKRGPRRRYGPDNSIRSWNRHFEGAEAVLHLAGDPSPRAALSDALRDNVEGTWNVLEAARRQSVPRVVYASSNWVVRRALREAHEEGPAPIREPLDVSPDTPYGLSKAAAELAGRMAVEMGQIRCFVAARIGSVEWKPPRGTRGALKDRLRIGVADLRTLLRLCLERPLTGFHVVYGISPTADRMVDLEATRRLLDWSPLDVPQTPIVEARVSQTA